MRAEQAIVAEGAGGSAAAPVQRRPGPAARRRWKVSPFWMKQFHAWHWMSAAVSLAAMLLFAVTGLTLNHAASIGATPTVTHATATLPAPLLRQLSGAHAADAPLPPAVARAVAASVALDPAGRAGEWSDDEVYVAMPGPGRDAWVSIDRASGAIEAERTWRGWLSYANDLHKGRNTGVLWFWFIDLFAVACIIFTLTGLLLLQLHAWHRRSTWPLVAVSLVVPVAVALFAIH